MKFSAAQFRIAYRMFYETMLDVWRGGWSNYVVISILTAVLVIFGLILQITYGLNFISQKLTDQLEFSAYLSEEADLQSIANSIGKQPYVRRVEVINKEIAWNEFKRNFTIADDFQNPLPNTIHIRVGRPDYLKSTIEYVKGLPGIVDINYAPGVLGFINKFKSLLQIVGITLTILLAFVTVVITGNTIQLVIHSRQNEIEVLRLMGVEDSYIKAPLILLGIFYAVIASTLAVLPLLLLQKLFLDTAQKLIGGMLPTGLPEYFLGDIFQIFIVLLLMGVLVAGSGCVWSTKKYLKI